MASSVYLFKHNVIIYMTHRAHNYCLQRVVLLTICLSMALFFLGLSATPSGAPVCVSMAALAAATAKNANMHRRTQWA